MKAVGKGIALLVFFGFASSANADGKRVCFDVAGIPYPPTMANHNVELADGETYLLTGAIHVKNGVGYFQPNFKTHPWLASLKRRQNPFYMMDRLPGNFDSSMLGKSVSIYLKAYLTNGVSNGRIRPEIRVIPVSKAEENIGKDFE